MSPVGMRRTRRVGDVPARSVPPPPDSSWFLFNLHSDRNFPIRRTMEVDNQWRCFSYNYYARMLIVLLMILVMSKDKDTLGSSMDMAERLQLKRPLSNCRKYYIPST